MIGLSDERSHCGQISTGAPQGTVLGPLLLILSTNSIEDVIKHCKHNHFIDVLQIYIQRTPNRVSEVIALVNENAKAIFDWV